MRNCIVANVFLLLLLVHNGMSAPLFKVFCDGTPLYRGRADPIISPGVVSGHVHKVAGGGNFGVALASQTPLQVYNDLVASSCTTCSIGRVDLSAYWHPDLYYQWDNGTLSLVPSGGLTVYYLARSGSGTQANPQWKAFPPGFRMVSGNPFRRSFNASSVADQAINFACLSEPGGPETNNFPTGTRFCKNGLRMQVHFPQCWDGVNVDSPSHTSHVAFPTSPDGGNCPPTHPVRLPNLFFEAFYSVSDFPHGNLPNNRQPFVLACGDSTGYGFHGDFLSGWNQTVLQAALLDPTCDSTNTNNGNDVRSCATLSQYVQDTPTGACALNKPIPINEFLGLAVATPTLPGCNPITSGPASATPCAGSTAATYKPAATVRFHLKSVQTSKYLRTPSLQSIPLSVNTTVLDYTTTYTAIPYADNYVALLNDATNHVWSANGDNSAILANRLLSQVANYEKFLLIAQANNQVAIQAKKNGKYLTVAADGTIAPTSTTIGTPQLFVLVIPDGGSV